MIDEARNPWVRRSRTTAYENPWIEVWHDEVVRPDGSDGIYGVVHFRSRAVGVVVLDDEDPLEGIKRELAEETGYAASRWRELIRFTVSNSVTDEEGVMFVATEPEEGAASPEPTEELATRWVPFEEAIAMVDRGEIHDVITQAALSALARDRTTGP
jgi:8-oxo-dGTP pyrophosphatase MutT (NUDIX family)